MVSIIIVNYHVKKELWNCIKSIKVSRSKNSYEIIVVDNDEKKSIEKELKQKFPTVIYVPNENKGFGQGNNVGIRRAKGKYLFFLNPDTKIYPGSIDFLVEYLNQHQDVAIAAPLVMAKDGIPYPLQGARELTPFRAIVSLSFINKLFPWSRKFQEYWMSDWDKKSIREVASVPGTSFMIRKDVYGKVEGFDEYFFLYFEEMDLCKRVREKGWKIVMCPPAKVYHAWGSSTKKSKRNMTKIFEESKFYYFRKHFGIVPAIFVKLITSLSKYHLILFVIVAMGFFLRTYKLNEYMSFIGDQGWFYLSARDMLLNGKIPLVGITSSHTWLHQGPLWTYMLSIPLAVSKFNPVSGGYLTAILGTITVLLIYKIGSELFSVKSGVIASLLYAVSPLAIAFDRMPYHTSPIALFTTLYFYVLFKWINGNAIYFPVTILLIAILYNFELATFILFFPFVLLFAYGLFRHKAWAIDVFDKKIIIYSLISFVIPMLPVIIYDFSNGFKQTIVFLGWTLYKPFSFFINHSSNNFIPKTSILMNFIFVSIQKLVFSPNLFISLSIFSLSILLLIYKVFINSKLKIYNSTFLLIFLLTFSLVGIFINQTPSDAYLPIIFPFVIFAVALLFDFLFKIKRIEYFFVLVFILIVSLNIRSGIQNDIGNGFRYKVQAVDKIINLTKNQKYNLIGRGPGSQFSSFTMNYEYLLWLKGNPPEHKNVNLKIYVSETPQSILINKKYD